MRARATTSPVVVQTSAIDGDRQSCAAEAVECDVGRLHIVTGPVAPAERLATRRSPVRIGFDAVCALLLLLVTAPVMAAAALAVRLSSHGPVFQRESALDDRGRLVEVLAFRVLVDGGSTHAHQHLRAVIGAAHLPPLTSVGRLLRATRLDRLPRLVHVAAGRLPLF
jgi:lipopolysaccharide/colanic/teichoic acid biosynthesis glycosyltransferase